MTIAANPQLLRHIRHALASAIADAKAYEVPALCVRLGLADGTEQEAFASRLKYAKARLAGVTGAKLVAMARELLADQDHYELAEALAKLEENGSRLVTELTRRRIISLFANYALSNAIEELEFLRRVWPIHRMPSACNRNSLEDDIYQHTINNCDWSNRELLEALGLLTCSQAQLFKFLAEAVHPVVVDEPRQEMLVDGINKALRHDGYILAPHSKISGSTVYVVRPLASGAPSDDSISHVLAAFNPDGVHARWTATLERRSSDPSGAITLARTLLEDVCKWILNEAGEAWKDDDDLPVLYRKLAKVLKLAPDDHTEQVFKQILGCCQSVVESLGALRNKLGDAHSVGPKRARPAARHAELAVNLSGTMAMFLIETWKARRSESKNTQA
jgi:hypothetical protein